MKIGILTQPIHINYGGTLQAYALQKVLQDMGHDAWLVRREPYIEKNLDYWIRTNVGNIIRYIRHQPLRRWTWLGPKPAPQRDIVEQNIQAFSDKWISPRTELIYSTEGLMEDLEAQKYDAYIVGSDQVWRPRFNDTNQRNFWLDFLGEDTEILRIAYAASFGTDQWEYKGKLQDDCKRLANRFNAISVREDSGIDLLKDHFDVSGVQHVLDPTLLLKKEDYEMIVKEEKPKENGPILFSYLLDFKEQNIQLINEIASDKRVIVKAVRPKKKSSEFFKGDNPADFIIPPIPEWLRAFIDAEYVITDSFHGTVFSIIFNKPFVTLGNSERGTARLESLLKQFGLGQRFVRVTSKELVNNILKEDINWEEVNKKHELLRKMSLEFLTSALSKKH